MCGGGGGIMEAACRGFRSVEGATGVALGIIPGDDPAWANDHLDLVVPSGIGWARNAMIVRTASAVVAIAGAAGTLSEIAFAWQMGKPIVALSSTGGWASRLAGQSVDERPREPIMDAATPEEALSLLRGAIGAER